MKNINENIESFIKNSGRIPPFVGIRPTKEEANKK